MISEWPRISIVTPSYQQARFLPWTIRSVLGQGYEDLEYFVVDGGSTDGSVEVIRNYESRLSWWCSEPDGGQTQAINKGFRRATGEIVGWVNSDDMLLPGCLHRVAKAFRDPAVQVICGWGVMMSESGHLRRRWVLGQPTASQLRAHSVLFQPSVFWRRSLFGKVGFLDETFRLCMDQDFFARMAEQDVIPRLLPKFLSAYRKHAETKTNLGASVGLEESSRIRSRFAGCNEVRERPTSWKALRFFWQKATMFVPPYQRGLDIHALYEVPGRGSDVPSILE